MKNSIVGLKKLRENVEFYISRIEQGESFVVVRRSKPVFKISPPENDDAWESVIDFTKIQQGGVEITDLLSCL